MNRAPRLRRVGGRSLPPLHAAGSAAQTPLPFPSMSPTLRTPEQLARGWRQALVDRDARGFADLFAPDGVMIDVEHRTADLREARPIAGRAAIEQLASEWLSSTPAFEFEITGLLSDDSTVAYRWSYGVPGETGSVALEGITWMVCSGGMISEALVCFDSYGLMHGLGRLGPAEAR
jgi:hypothetical protein